MLDHGASTWTGTADEAGKVVQQAFEPAH